jgi:hypothetical protein
MRIYIKYTNVINSKQLDMFYKAIKNESARNNKQGMGMVTKPYFPLMKKKSNQCNNFKEKHIKSFKFKMIHIRVLDGNNLDFL